MGVSNRNLFLMGMIRNARKPLPAGVEMMFKANIQPAVGVVVHLG